MEQARGRSLYAQRGTCSCSPSANETLKREGISKSEQTDPRTVALEVVKSGFAHRFCSVPTNQLAGALPSLGCSPSLGKDGLTGGELGWVHPDKKCCV